MDPISTQPAFHNTNHDRPATPVADPQVESGFSRMLEQTIGRVNRMQNHADAAVKDLTTGKRSDIHETMIAAEKASIAFELMLQIRNKIVGAYETVMRTSL